MNDRMCSVGMCTMTVHSFGLCATHYHRLRLRMIRDGEWRPSGEDRSTQICCRCVTPKWDSCAPLFPTVRVCRWCGSPDAAQFGEPLETPS